MRWCRRIFTVGIVLPASWMGYRAYDDWRFRVESREVGRAVMQRRYPEARRQLLALLERRANEGESLYHLGVCELGLGRTDQALKAWSKVPEGSPFSGQASVGLARHELARHRLSPAETLMKRAQGGSGPHAIEAIKTLVTLYKIEGRYEEAERLVRTTADRYPDKIAMLQEWAKLRSIDPYKLALVRDGLETASRSSPDDDRVWLGWANLATRIGQFDQADMWLERCRKRRPEDPAVLRGKLMLALATRDTQGAAAALGHLPPESVEPAEVLSYRAWFANQSGDVATERRSLGELLGLEPGNLPALERFAELEQVAGKPEKAAQLRVRKAELDRAKARYETLLFQPGASQRVAELAHLADTLGRGHEAKILWSMAVKQRPGDPGPIEALSRISKGAPPKPPADSTLPALLASRPGLNSRAEEMTSSRTGRAAPDFTDDADATGLRFTFDNGIDPLKQLPETMSGGVGLLDYDSDGWLDVYCVQGGSFLADPKKPTGGDRLFRNRGDGTFEDATAASGIGTMPKGYGHGVAVGDFNNDGYPDLFITRWNAYALYRNKGDGTFEDATADAGLGGARDWPTSAAFADLDGDGDLDLYVAHYLEWDPANPQVCIDPGKNTPVVCGPRLFRSRPDHLFRNDNGRFVDLTKEAGIVDAHGKGLGVVACDFDQDGLVDLFVSNDQSANFLYHNRGGLKFDEVGELSGIGSSPEGEYLANMGIALGDLDGDGRPDLAVTEFYNEGTTLFLNLGNLAFADHSNGVGLRVVSRCLLGFGSAFIDFDADGFLDLATTNGHVDDFRPSEPYRMPCQLLAGTPKGRLVDVTAQAGVPWQVPRLGRGLASGDLDNDGRVDLVILSQNQPLAYFHNKTRGGHHLTLKLEGTVSNRDAVGAKVSVAAGGRSQSAWRLGGGSYQSACDSRLHFGLGKAERVDKVDVTWPSGKVEAFEGVAPDGGFLLREGDGHARPLARRAVSRK